MNHTIDTYSTVFAELAEDEMFNRIMRAQDWVGAIAMPETYTSYDYAFTCSSGGVSCASNKQDAFTPALLLMQSPLMPDEEEYSLMVRFK